MYKKKLKDYFENNQKTNDANTLKIVSINSAATSTSQEQGYHEETAFNIFDEAVEVVWQFLSNSFLDFRKTDAFKQLKEISR